MNKTNVKQDILLRHKFNDPAKVANDDNYCSSMLPRHADLHVNAHDTQLKK